MEPLTSVALRHGVDYQRVRGLIIRGEVEGELREGRWYCSSVSLAAWKAAQGTAKPADDAPGAPDAPAPAETPDQTERAS